MICCKMCFEVENNTHQSKTLTLVSLRQKTPEESNLYRKRYPKSYNDPVGGISSIGFTPSPLSIIITSRFTINMIDRCSYI